MGSALKHIVNGAFHFYVLMFTDDDLALIAADKALVDQGILVADSSLGELLIGDGTYTLELDFTWLFADYEDRIPDGFSYVPATLEIQADMLPVYSSPQSSAQEESSGTIGTLAQGDYVVRIASSDTQSMILYGGEIGYISNSHVTVHAH
jgi:hypothetical protein